MSALLAFVEKLEQEFPEARLRLTRPAASVSDVRTRLDRLCEDYADICGCQADLDEQKAYTQYTRELAEALNVEPDKMRREVEIALTTASFAGPTAFMLFADGASHAAHASDVAVDAATHGLDVVEAGMSLGVSILITLGAGWLFKRLNIAKRLELERLTEKAMLNARLARSLVRPGKTGDTAMILTRLRQSGGRMGSA